MLNRLELVLSLINDSKGLADVGTDHGFIPIELAKSGYTGNLIGTDINRGPLNNAIMSAKKCGFENKIEFLLCDGLELVNKELIDTIVICGMGGDTIAGILDRSYWCAAEGFKLVLQPMSHQNVLRYWLINNEFNITSDYVVNEGDKVYQVITAEYGKGSDYRDSELFTGKFDYIKSYEKLDHYLETYISKFERAVEGLNKSNNTENQIVINYYNAIINELKNAEGDIK